MCVITSSGPEPLLCCLWNGLDLYYARTTIFRVVFFQMKGGCICNRRPSAASGSSSSIDNGKCFNFKAYFCLSWARIAPYL